MAVPSASWIKTSVKAGNEASATRTLVLRGAWYADMASHAEILIRTLYETENTRQDKKLNASTAREKLIDAKEIEKIIIDCSALSKFDTIGIYLIHNLQKKMGKIYAEVELIGLNTEQKALLDEVAASKSRQKPTKATQEEGVFSLFIDVGQVVVHAGRDIASAMAFWGQVITVIGRLFLGRARLRVPAIVNQLEKIALRGVPIIMLISFLVGAIIAQQSIFQLRQFGTVHLVADLIGILVLRELAVLLTAIMVAGRSGSAFTAELGSMKMREEIDALYTMGLEPIEVLVVPRIFALILALPILTFMASLAGILGGGIVAFFYGGVSWDVFFSRLQLAIGMNTFISGMLKAPFMALVIGLIACVEGFAVQGSSESLGAHTTASVVKSIFVVIVVDGLFAMFFAAINY